MYTKVNLVCFSLIVTFSFAVAKFNYNQQSYSQSIRNFLTNNSPEDSNESYEDDYEDVVCEPSSLPPHPDSMCCGVDTTSNNRIVGGQPTALNQYPWLVRIEYKMIGYKNWYASRCGGFLISGRHVLTAAHCVAGEILLESTPYNVVVGDYDRSNEGPDCITTKEGKQCTEGAKRIRIEKVFAHEEYIDKKMTNDIALIKLKFMAPYNDAVRPICLPTSDLLDTARLNQFLYVSGWGTMKQVKVGEKFTGTSSSVKRHARLPFVPTKVCKSVWRSMVTEKQICAGGTQGKDACMGDSGGALMNENGGIFEAVGVVSFGSGDPCGKPGIPGVYTNVYKYRNWISQRLRL